MKYPFRTMHTPTTRKGITPDGAIRMPVRLVKSDGCDESKVRKMAMKEKHVETKKEREEKRKEKKQEREMRHQARQQSSA